MTVVVLMMKCRCPSMGLHYMVPNRTNVDARLIVGAAIFGFGWGFSGWCPGPAVANLFPVWFDNSQVCSPVAPS